MVRGNDVAEIMSMIDLMLVRFNAKIFAGCEDSERNEIRCLTSLCVVLCKLKRREVVNRGRRIGSEKLRKYQYKGYVTSLENNRMG